MLQEASDEYDRIQGRLDVNAVKKQIEDYTKEERENETEIASLNRLSVLESEIRLHQSNHKSKMDQVTAIREKHEDRLKTILDVDDIPAKKLLSLIESAQLKLVIFTTSKCFLTSIDLFEKDFLIQFFTFFYRTMKQQELEETSIL